MRSMSRSLAAAAVVLALTVLSVPAAHARPLDRETPAPRVDTWFEAALSWIGSFLPSGLTGTDRDGVQMATLSGTDTGTGTTTGGAHPMTGSCIDPQGSPRCGGI